MNPSKSGEFSNIAIDLPGRNHLMNFVEKAFDLVPALAFEAFRQQ